MCKYGGYIEYQGFKTSHDDKYIDGKYQVIKGFVESSNVVTEIASVDNLADYSIKTLVARIER